MSTGARLSGSSGRSNADVERRVDEVDDQVADDDEERREHPRPEDDREVPGRDGLHGGLTDALQAEDRLGDDGAAEQRPQVDAEQRHDGGEGAAQAMPEYDA